jgi:hypothetical protein
MQCDELMRQFADVVGRAMARRWLTQRLASRHQESETDRDSIGKVESEYPSKSQRSQAEHEHE